MRHILTVPREVKSAIFRFRQRIAALSNKSSQREWDFPDGSSDKCSTYSVATPHGQLLIGLPNHWETRVPHLFRLENSDSGGTLSANVQVNIPTRLDRRVSGAYLREGGSIWLCSRGDFTVFRERIPRKNVFRHFQNWLIETGDGDRSTEVIPVAALHSKTLERELGEFVHSVIALKSAHRNGAGDTTLKDATWNEGKESEGKRHRNIIGGTTTYDYLHGPLCNSLQNTLQQLIQGYERFKVRRNKNVDVAVVDVTQDVAHFIFEVKTSSVLTEQLYSAIGQLFYYRHRYGNANSRLFLVLPRECVGHHFGSQKFLTNLGITTIVNNNGKFETLEGRLLAQVIRPALRA